VAEAHAGPEHAKVRRGSAGVPEAYGLEKSSISEHYIEASQAKLKQIMERRLDKLNLCALLIDATPFAGQQMVAALGISQDGRKTILGLRAPRRTPPWWANCWVI
jgi:transposase-like protein